METETTILEYAQLSRAPYVAADDPTYGPPAGWAPIGEPRHDPDTGYHGQAYRNLTTNEIVISSRGSYVMGNIVPDVQLGLGYTPQRARAAIQYAREIYEAEVRAGNPAPVISATGHSLGGHDAQVIATHFANADDLPDIPAVTFQAPGIADENVRPGTKYDILNLYNKADVVRYFGGRHPGVNSALNFGPEQVHDVLLALDPFKEFARYTAASLPGAWAVFEYWGVVPGWANRLAATAPVQQIKEFITNLANSPSMDALGPVAQAYFGEPQARLMAACAAGYLSHFMYITIDGLEACPALGNLTSKQYQALMRNKTQLEAFAAMGREEYDLFEGEVDALLDDAALDLLLAADSNLAPSILEKLIPAIAHILPLPGREGLRDELPEDLRHKFYALAGRPDLGEYLRGDRIEANDIFRKVLAKSDALCRALNDPELPTSLNSRTLGVSVLRGLTGQKTREALLNIPEAEPVKTLLDQVGSNAHHLSDAFLLQTVFLPALATLQDVKIDSAIGMKFHRDQQFDLRPAKLGDSIGDPIAEVKDGVFAFHAHDPEQPPKQRPNRQNQQFLHEDGLTVLLLTADQINQYSNMDVATVRDLIKNPKQKSAPFILGPGIQKTQQQKVGMTEDESNLFKKEAAKLEGGLTKTALEQLLENEPDLAPSLLQRVIPVIDRFNNLSQQEDLQNKIHALAAAPNLGEALKNDPAMTNSLFCELLTHGLITPVNPLNEQAQLEDLWRPLVPALVSTLDTQKDLLALAGLNETRVKMTEVTTLGKDIGDDLAVANPLFKAAFEIFTQKILPDLQQKRIADLEIGSKLHPQQQFAAKAAKLGDRIGEPIAELKDGSFAFHALDEAASPDRRPSRENQGFLRDKELPILVMSPEQMKLCNVSISRVREQINNPNIQANSFTIQLETQKRKSSISASENKQPEGLDKSTGLRRRK